MKRRIIYIISMIMVSVILIFINFAVIIGIEKATDNNRYYIHMERFSNSLQLIEEEYVMDKKASIDLMEIHAFAMLINQNGSVIWEQNKPEDIPKQYSLCDVASFSRWYLNGYPVYIRTRDDGIFVIGFPRNSIWKYSLEFGLSTIKNFIHLSPYLMIANMLVLFLVPAWIVRRGMISKEKQRSEWIAGISHDIRTPLSIILGYAPEGSVIQSQSLRIKELINNLNTENKLEAGKGAWNKTNIPIYGFLQNIICESMNINNDRYTWLVEIDQTLDDHIICADDSLIRRMIENIISNSIRHNPNGCEIFIQMRPVNNRHIELIIEDNGSGADELTIQKLNQRLKSEYLPEHGLGLRVVKQIAKKYKFQITFSSIQGQGFKTKIIINSQH